MIEKISFEDRLTELEFYKYEYKIYINSKSSHVHYSQKTTPFVLIGC